MRVVTLFLLTSGHSNGLPRDLLESSPSPFEGDYIKLFWTTVRSGTVANRFHRKNSGFGVVVRSSMDAVRIIRDLLKNA